MGKKLQKQSNKKDTKYPKKSVENKKKKKKYSSKKIKKENGSEKKEKNINNITHIKINLYSKRNLEEYLKNNNEINLQDIMIK